MKNLLNTLIALFIALVAVAPVSAVGTTTPNIEGEITSGVSFETCQLEVSTVDNEFLLAQYEARIAALEEQLEVATGVDTDTFYNVGNGLEYRYIITSVENGEIYGSPLNHASYGNQQIFIYESEVEGYGIKVGDVVGIVWGENEDEFTVDLLSRNINP